MLGEIERDREPYLLKHLAVKGSDIPLNASGGTTGEILASLLELVIERPELNDRETLIGRIN